MTQRVLFYQLNRKYVSNQAEVPARSRQIVYYSLAIGHHVGVVDCLASVLVVSEAEFTQWLSRLPAGAGRRKLEGVLKWGEVEVNAAHVNELLPALEAGYAIMSAAERDWTDALRRHLQDITQEPALYLMIRRSAG